MKNGFGFMGTIYLGFMFPIGGLETCLQAYFLFNWSYFVIKRMLNCIDKMDLHEDGEHVTLRFKYTNQTKRVKIENLYKKEDEKVLV